MDSATVVPPYVARPMELLPFRAVMLAPSRVGDPASARALARPYRAVADRLTDWISRGRATRDESPAVYLHEYTVAGLTIRGLVGALVMSRRAADPEDRAVWPHEGIHPEQAGELADRMFSMGLNPAPILLVHRGPEALRALMDRVSTAEPDWSFLDRTDQRQRIWAVRDPRTITEVNELLTTSRCLLADGHHRYAAYLRLQEQHPGTDWDAGLAMVVDQSDTPLFLGAIHRTFEGSSIDDVLAAVTATGATVVRDASRRDALAALDPDHLVITDGTSWHVVRPGDLATAAAVSWLHDRVVPLVEPRPRRIDHHHSVDAAIENAGPSSPAILLPGPDFRQVSHLVESGGLLPEKATSFQPKPSLGVLMRPVHDG